MITNRQIRAARAWLSWRQEELARASGVSLATVQNIERGADGRMETLRRIKAAFEQAGIAFTEGDGLRQEERRR